MANLLPMTNTTDTLVRGGRLALGPTKFSPGGYVEFARYGSGELAMLVLGEDGQAQIKPTVSLVPYGAPDPGEYGCWIKDWSENEGVSDALIRSDIVKFTGRTFKTGFVEAKHAELTDIARAALAKASAP